MEGVEVTEDVCMSCPQLPPLREERGWPRGAGSEWAGVSAAFPGQQPRGNSLGILSNLHAAQSLSGGNKLNKCTLGVFLNQPL